MLKVLSHPLSYPSYREQGWRSGESTRLPHMWLGIDSQTQNHIWVSLWLVFLQILRCCPLLKNQHFQIPIRSGFKCRNSNSVEVLLQIPITSSFYYSC